MAGSCPCMCASLQLTVLMNVYFGRGGERAAFWGRGGQILDNLVGASPQGQTCTRASLLTLAEETLTRLSLKWPS